MMKIKGKTYDFSPFKMFISDQTYSRLKQLVKKYEFKNNAACIDWLINGYFINMDAAEKAIKDNAKIQNSEVNLK